MEETWCGRGARGVTVWAELVERIGDVGHVDLLSVSSWRGCQVVVSTARV